MLDCIEVDRDFATTRKDLQMKQSWSTGITTCGGMMLSNEDVNDRIGELVLDHECSPVLDARRQHVDAVLSK